MTTHTDRSSRLWTERSFNVRNCCDPFLHQGTWQWYGWRRFKRRSGWLRAWQWVKFKRGPEPFAWRLVVGPFELRKIRPDWNGRPALTTTADSEEGS